MCHAEEKQSPGQGGQVEGLCLVAITGVPVRVSRLPKGEIISLLGKMAASTGATVKTTGQGTLVEMVGRRVEVDNLMPKTGGRCEAVQEVKDWAPVQQQVWVQQQAWVQVRRQVR